MFATDLLKTPRPTAVLDELPPASMRPLTRIWLGILRGYLIVAGGLVLWRIVELALSTSR